MHSHLTEVVTETWFHEGASHGIEWLTGRAQDVMHGRWNSGVLGLFRKGMTGE
jgi:hypothetical protein